MSRVENTIVIDRPIEEVWRFFTDLDNLTSWYPGIRRVTRRPGGAIASGAAIGMSGAVGPLPFGFAQRVTAFEPYRAIELRGGHGCTRLDFERVGAGTWFTQTTETRGLLALVGGLSGPKGEERDAFFARLKQLLEERIAPVPGQDVEPLVPEHAPPPAQAAPPPAQAAPPPAGASPPHVPDEAPPPPPAAAEAAPAPVEIPPEEAAAPSAAAPPPEPAGPAEVIPLPAGAAVVPDVLEPDVLEPEVLVPPLEEEPTGLPETDGQPAEQPLVEPARVPAHVAGGLVLRLETGRAEEPTFEVTQAGATLGSSQDNTIRLDDLSVSRKHARITFRQGGYWLSDQRSTSGTWVDGAKLNAPRRVAAGQTIDIGILRLRVESAPAAEGATSQRGAPSEVAGQGRRRR